MAFPINPVNDQVYNDGTYTYKYNSMFRSWTKVAQTTSNVSNVVTTSGNVTLGNTTITSNTVSVGNTTVTGGNIIVGNTTVSGTNVTVGTTTVSSNNITVGTSVVSNNSITVGTTSVTSSDITVGSSIISNNIISVGTATVSENSISVGSTYLSSNSISVGTTVISSDGMSGNLTGNITGNLTGNLTSGTTTIIPETNGNVAITVSGTPNVLVIANSGTQTTGNASITGTVSAGNVVATSGVFNNTVLIGNGAIAVTSNTAGLFNSLVSDINMGLAANVTLGSTTGLVSVRNALDVTGNTTVGNLNTNNIQAANFYSKRPSISITANDTIIDSFNVNMYRSAKYTLKISDDTGYQALEVLLIHDNINSIITVYGSLSMTGLDLVILRTAINGSNVNLMATGVNANTSVNLMGTYVPD